MEFMLSSEQIRLWIEAQRNPNASVTQIHLLYRYVGKFDTEKFIKSLKGILCSEVIFNLKFSLLDGLPQCTIAPLENHQVEYYELSNFVNSEKEEVDYIENRANQPIDLLDSLPNYRMTIYRSLSDNAYYFSCALPHILVDAYSCDILLNKLADFYNGRSALGKYSAEGLLEKTAKFSFVKNDDLSGFSNDYWKEKIQHANLSLNLNHLFSSKRYLDKEGSYSCEYTKLTENDFLNFRSCAKELRTTPFILVMTIYSIILYRYTRQSTFSILYPVNIRDAEKKELLGYHVNLLPMVFDFDKNKTLSDLVQDLTLQRKSDKQHQTYAYSSIKNLARKKTDDFNILCSQTRFLSNFQLNDVHIEYVPVKTGHVGKSFSLLCDINAVSSVLCLEYDSALFPNWFAKQILLDVEQSICDLKNNLHVPIVNMPLLSTNKLIENDLLLSSPKKRIQKNYDVVERFFKMAKQKKDKLAISNFDINLSYKDLKEKIIKLVCFLKKNGIKRQDGVALLLDRHPDYIVSIIALCYLRCTYVPIDISTPCERMHHILNDSGVKYLICDKKNSCITHDFKLTVFSVENAFSEVEQVSNIPMHIDYHDDDIMYVIYTSGTTGKPKGVPITYAAINHLFHISDNYFDFSSEDIWTLLHSFSFDFSVWEMWGALLQGATLLLISDKIKRNPNTLYQCICENKVTVCNITPSAFKNLSIIDDIHKKELALRYVIFGGEKLVFSDLTCWFKRHTDEKPILVNMYGLTEAPIHATYHRVYQTDATLGDSLIGQGLDGNKLYVVDDLNQPLPAGVYGEMLLSSSWITKGYLGLDTLNKQKFLEVCFKGDPVSVYKTGDFACLLPSEILNFYGRLDQQVQLNGYRIELGEISHVLQETDFVSMAVSFIYEGRQQEKSIMTFCVGSQKEISKEQLFCFLKQKLPFYMIPADIFFIDQIPLTQQGKVNFNDLIQLVDKSHISSNNAFQRETKFTDSIKKIWQSILNLDEVGLDDNYFDVGGDSLSLLRLSYQLSSLFGKEITLNMLFQYTTIRSQAEYIEKLIHSISSDNKKDENLVAHLSDTSSNNLDAMEDIAVVGMAVNAPEAETLKQFWENLKSGKESISFVKNQDLKEDAINSNRLKNYVAAKGMLTDADCFDAGFFGYSDYEATLLDPQHRILLQCAYAGLEDAGYLDELIAGSIGVFVGQSNITSYYFNEIMPTIKSATGFSQQYQALINNSADFLATRIAYKLNLTGSAMTIQTGCSTSLVAICEAASQLRARQCDLAIAGGVCITLPLQAGYHHEEGMILSSDGHCRAFDEKANGTVPGNGAGIVVLKRYNEAIKDNDHIYAVIKGHAVNNDGHRKIGFTAPSQVGQKEVIKKALTSSGIAANTIDAIEAHGTGTKLGDPIEIAALDEAFASRSSPYIIGSVKSNIGHLDAASGVLGFIKMTLSLKYKTLIPTVHFKTRNSNIISDKANILQTAEHWQKRDYPRRAGVSSFAVGGTNAHVILEEMTNAQLPDTSNNDVPYLFVLSAHTKDNLSHVIEQLANYLHEENCSPSTVAQTLQLGRRSLRYRCYYVANTIPDLVRKLSQSKLQPICSADSEKIRCCFLFSGKAIDYKKEVKVLYAHLPVFRKVVDYCVNQLEKQYAIDISKLFLSDDANSIEKTAHDFDKVSELFAFVLGYAIGKQWIALGVEPTGLLGHGVGEYVSACLAEIWTVENALSIIMLRQKLMQKLPSDVILDVPIEGIKDKSYRSQVLEIIQSELKVLMLKFSTRKPKYLFVSNITGDWITQEQLSSPEYWAKQMEYPVEFSQGIKNLTDMKGAVLIESSLDGKLAAFAQQYRADVSTFSLAQNAEDKNPVYTDLLSILGHLWQQGVNIDWCAFNQDKMISRIPLPTYPFEKKPYWITKTESTNKELKTRSTDMLKLYQPSWTAVRNESSSNIKIEKESNNAVYLIFSNDIKINQIIAGELKDKVVYTCVLPKHIISSGEIILKSEDAQVGLTEFLAQVEENTDLHVIYSYMENSMLENDFPQRENIMTLLQQYLILLQSVLGKYNFKLSLSLLTNGLFHIRAYDKINPFSSMLYGLAVTAVKEREAADFVMIDLSFSETANCLNDNRKAVLSDILHRVDSNIVAYRGKQRFVRDFLEIKPNLSFCESIKRKWHLCYHWWTWPCWLGIC